MKRNHRKTNPIRINKKGLDSDNRTTLFPKTRSRSKFDEQQQKKKSPQQIKKKQFIQKKPKYKSRLKFQQKQVGQNQMKLKSKIKSAQKCRSESKLKESDFFYLEKEIRNILDIVMKKKAQKKKKNIIHPDEISSNYRRWEIQLLIEAYQRYRINRLITLCKQNANQDEVYLKRQWNLYNFNKYKRTSHYHEGQSQQGFKQFKKNYYKCNNIEELTNKNFTRKQYIIAIQKKVSQIWNKMHIIQKIPYIYQFYYNQNPIEKSKPQKNQQFIQIGISKKIKQT